jgi:hypothetical protein
MVIIVAAIVAYASLLDRSVDVTQDKQLQAWLAQERETQARLEAGAGPGVVKPEEMAARSGLEMMQAMLRGELPYPPIARTLNFQLLEVDAGRALFQGTPGPDHFNVMSGIHAAGMRRCWIRRWAAPSTP